MMDRRSLFGTFLIVAIAYGPSDADDNFVNGTMTANDKTYALTDVKAYRIRSNKVPSISVIASEKPFHILDPMFPITSQQKKFIPTGVIADSATPAESPAHIQVVYDEKTGKVASFQGWSHDGPFSRRISPPPGEWSMKIEGKRIVGSAETRANWESFRFEFTAEIQQLKLKTESEISVP
jgi:hypothetical protein